MTLHMATMLPSENQPPKYVDNSPRQKITPQRVLLTMQEKIDSAGTPEITKTEHPGVCT